MNMLHNIQTLIMAMTGLLRPEYKAWHNTTLWSQQPITEQNRKAVCFDFDALHQFRHRSNTISRVIWLKAGQTEVNAECRSIQNHTLQVVLPLGYQLMKQQSTKKSTVI